MSEKEYHFLNRDLSWLSFNYRVLLEAKDKTVPLYSRISFLSIFSSNLDEFFRVRMPAILALSGIESKKISISDEYPKDLAEQVQHTLKKQLAEYGRVLTEEMLPALEENNIILYYDTVIRPEHNEAIRDYFLSRVLSFIQPVLLRKENREDIFLENNALYFIADIEAIDSGKRRHALINIPSDKMPRFMELNPVEEQHYIIFLDDIVRENVNTLFPGYLIHGVYSIKLTRDAEMNVEDEYTGDIAEKIEKQLEKRDIGRSTRFLHEQTMSEGTIEFVKNYFGLSNRELFAGGRYHNLKDLGNLPNPSDKKLTYPQWPVVKHPRFNSTQSIFKTIDEGDRLLHLPYHSYNYILRFFNEAAIDPFVKEIYVTLYRVASDSQIVNALISAAKNGKKVTVFVELKARFDEANNLNWSKKMKAAGIKIINSIPGLKVHAKVALVNRAEQKQWQHYSFMATGNFNESTGRFYTDHVLFTANHEFSTELEWLFEYLQSRIQPGEYVNIPFKHLLVSQFNLIKRFSELIDREIENARKGKSAKIIIKLNNLEERGMISKLYDAANAGVKVELITRSICCLSPGQNGNITVRRIVDRYLEHARVFIFHNDGMPEYFMGSADWMKRNLFSRIEVCFPVYDKSLCDQINHILQLQLNDTKKAVLLNDELENLPVSSQQEGGSAAQEAIYNYVKELSGTFTPIQSQSLPTA
ncbi:MAG: polyphosphate kinase 1 [Chitinophagaceae bacterium]